MFAVIKKYCIYLGPCFVGDIVEVKKPNEYMAKFEFDKKPRTNILTRGTEPARVAAHNLPFNQRVPESSADSFKILYVSCERCLREFFSVTYDGKKAVISALNISEARKLFNELPTKLFSENYLFNPEAHRSDIAHINRDNADVKQREKEANEALEKQKENSALYVKSGSSLGAG